MPGSPVSSSIYRIDTGTPVEIWSSYTYLTDGRLSSMLTSGIGNNVVNRYTYDELKRVAEHTYYYSTGSTVMSGKFCNTVTYGYLTGESDDEICTSMLVSSYLSTVGMNAREYIYEYDARGNITSVDIDLIEQYRYYYDSKNQLVREDNVPQYKTIVYNYDSAGNITSKKTYSLTAANATPSGTCQTDSYTYPTATENRWNDALLTYKEGEITYPAITYDSIGNPINYYNGYTFTWEGRRLVGATKGSTSMSFVYNDEGLRTSKTVNGVTTEYFYVGTQLMAEITPTYEIYYYYDASGSPIGFDYKATGSNIAESYFYRKNLQGDITDVYSSTGALLISYTYDAYGNFTTSYSYFYGGTSTNAAKNPFTYRGYYYDQDLGMYYLQSRYYDSNICRFISPDSSDVITATPMGLTDKNLYAYCDNNPVTRVDESGEIWVSLLIGAVIGALGQLASDLVTSAIEGELSFSHWSVYLGAAVGGAVSVIVPGVDVLRDIVGNGVSTIVSAVSYNIESAIIGRDEYYSSEEVFCTVFVDSIFTGMMGLGLGERPLLSKVSNKKIIGDKLTNKLINRSTGKLAKMAAKNATNKLSFRSLAEIGISSAFGGLRTSVMNHWPNTHTWKSPNVERRYPFR